MQGLDGVNRSCNKSVRSMAGKEKGDFLVQPRGRRGAEFHRHSQGRDVLHLLEELALADCFEVPVEAWDGSVFSVCAYAKHARAGLQGRQFTSPSLDSDLGSDSNPRTLI